MSDKVYKLYSLVKINRGYYQSVILDLQRLSHYTVPNSMTDLVRDHEFDSIDSVVNKYGDSEDKKIVSNYFEFLLERELIFTFDREDKQLYKNRVPVYDIPDIISNTIIRLKETDYDFLRNLMTEIESLGCKHIQIKLNYEVNANDLTVLEALFFNSAFLSIELIILKLNDALSDETIINFVGNVGRIKNIFIFNADKYLIINSVSHTGNIVFSRNSLEADREFIDRDNFSVNEISYAEATKFNLYYNKKLFIDYDRSVKNSFLSESYGFAGEDSLKSIVETKEFQRKWTITKDMIDICQDCEFRKICVDFRIPILKGKKYYFEDNTACSYNPYIGLWKNEEGYISVENWRCRNPKWDEQARLNRDNTCYF